jgi:hypothetical protein
MIIDGTKMQHQPGNEKYNFTKTWNKKQSANHPKDILFR